jgi:hypothetical protein
MRHVASENVQSVPGDHALKVPREPWGMSVRRPWWINHARLRRRVWMMFDKPIHLGKFRQPPM